MRRFGVRSSLYWTVFGLAFCILSLLFSILLALGEYQYRQVVAHGVKVDATITRVDLDNRFPFAVVKLPDNRSATVYDIAGRPRVGERMRIAYLDNDLSSAAQIDASGPAWQLAAEAGFLAMSFGIGVLALQGAQRMRADDRSVQGQP